MPQHRVNVYVIGVDPGLSMGVYILRNAERWGFIQGAPKYAIDAIDLTLTKLHDDEPEAQVAIACERYISGGRGQAKTHQPIPNIMAGQVQLLAERHKVPLFWQSPADAKKFAPTAFLKEHGLYIAATEVNKRDANDVNDAARHAVLLLARRFAVVYEKLLNA